MIRRSTALAAALLALAAVPLPAAAAELETPFAGIDTTNLQPAGELEAEQRLEWKHGRPGESFDAVQGQTELEYGLTPDLQIGGYVRYAWSRVRPRLPPGTAADSGVEFHSVAAEVVYRIWDVESDPLGVAVYFEPTIGPDVRELEWKLLLEKDLLDGRLVLAANLVLENEWERVPGDWQTHTDFNILAGAAYRFAPHWTGGLEFASEREFDGLLPWRANNAAANSYFLGPTLQYITEDFYVTVGFQAQLPWAQNLSGEPGETVGGFAHEAERYRLRMRMGIDL